MNRPRPPDASDRDPVLDAAWKANSAELPPRHLDAAILAAAHREAQSRPRPAGDDDAVAHARSPARAFWGFAAAATIGAIAFGVLQLVPRSSIESTPGVATDVPRAGTQGVARSDVSRDQGAPNAAPPASVPEAARRKATPSLREDHGSTARSLAPDVARDESAAVLRSDEPGREASRRRDAAQGTLAETMREDDRSVARGQDVPRKPAASLRDGEASMAASQAPDAPTFAAQTFAAQPGAAAVRPQVPQRASESERKENVGSAFPGPAPATPTGEVTPAVPASPPVPPAAAPRSEPPASRAEARSEVQRASAAAPARSALQADRHARADSAATPIPVAKVRAPTPAEWSERIRVLHAQRRFDDAARELDSFRDAYSDADAQLPAELRAWAAGIERRR